MNDFGTHDGRLEWEYTQPSKVTNFLDLTLELTSTGKIKTKTFTKQMNLFLYIPADSAHPQSLIRGLIFGQI